MAAVSHSTGDERSARGCGGCGYGKRGLRRTVPNFLRYRGRSGDAKSVQGRTDHVTIIPHVHSRLTVRSSETSRITCNTNSANTTGIESPPALARGVGCHDFQLINPLLCLFRSRSMMRGRPLTPYQQPPDSVGHRTSYACCAVKRPW